MKIIGLLIILITIGVVIGIDLFGLDESKYNDGEIEYVDCHDEYSNKIIGETCINERNHVEKSMAHICVVVAWVILSVLGAVLGLIEVSLEKQNEIKRKN